MNVVHAALVHWRDPARMLDSLLDEIGPERLEIDWLAVRGPAFPGADNRLLSLGLVHRGSTPAVLFDAAGRPELAAEAMRKKCLLVERGRFAPVTRLNLEMRWRATEAFAADGATDIAELLQISTTSLRGGQREADADFLDRVELIAAAGKMVLVSALDAFHDLAAYLAALCVRPRPELHAVRACRSENHHLAAHGHDDGQKHRPPGR